MILKKPHIIGLLQALLLFLIFWVAKKPLLFLLNDVSNDVLFLVGAILILLTLVLSWILLRLDALEAATFQLVIMLVSLPIALIYGVEFGVYKVFSLILMLNLVVIIYLINRASFNIKTILLTMAGIFLFYGLISSVWLYSINYDLQQREIIGFNGPIVFGQYLIISFTIYLLYGNKLKGYTAFLLSFLSLSKGPFIAGLLTIYLNSRSKFKFLIYILLLAASVLIFAPNIRVLEWLTHLNSVEDLLKLSSISARVDAYTQSYYLISESLMGLGWGGWKEVSYLKYPHNIFLEILVELPLILAVFFIFYIGFVFYSIKDKRYRILFSIMLLMALFSGSIIDNRGIFFITMLFLLAGKSKNDPC